MCNTLSTHKKLHVQNRPLRCLFSLLNPWQYFVQKINISSFFLTYIQTIYISFENCFVLYTKFTQKDILRKRIKSLLLSNHDCKNNIFIFSLWCCYYFKFYHKLLFFKKADLLVLHWNNRLQQTEIWGICVSRLPAPICFWRPRLQFVYRGSSPQFVFTSLAPQSVFAGPQPTICIYRSWLIRIGNNKSQRLCIMLLLLFLLSNSFVTVISCCSLLLFASQVVVHYHCHWIFVFPATSLPPQPSICIYGPQPSICVCLLFLQPKFVIVTVSTYINSASTYMLLTF